MHTRAEGGDTLTLGHTPVRLRVDSWEGYRGGKELRVPKPFELGQDAEDTHKAAKAEERPPTIWEEWCQRSEAFLVDT